MSGKNGMEAGLDGRATPTSIAVKADDLTIDIPLANNPGGQQALLQQRKKREDSSAQSPGE